MVHNKPALAKARYVFVRATDRSSPALHYVEADLFSCIANIRRAQRSFPWEGSESRAALPKMDVGWSSVI